MKPESTGPGGANADDGRDETEQERHDRNWTEILQELRVIQTGTQILTGFLLTIPFQQRFATLDGYQVGTYLVLVVIAALATVLALAPVALHRTLFRRRAKGVMVVIANRVLKITMATVGLTLTGTVMLVFDVVLSLGAGLVAGAIALVVVIAAWLALPLGVRRRHPQAP
jgi:hypothetical protein